MTRTHHAPLPRGPVQAALRCVGTETRICVTVKARSPQEGLEVGSDEALWVRVNAPPVDGQANLRVVKVLAQALGLRKADLKITRGESARFKELAVEPLSVSEVVTRLCGVDAAPDPA